MFAERILNIHVAIRSTLLLQSRLAAGKESLVKCSSALTPHKAQRRCAIAAATESQQAAQAAAQPTSKLSRSALTPAITPSYQNL
jgi:microcystin-dependent protein